jgi:hypothetical protein
MEIGKGTYLKIKEHAYTFLKGYIVRVETAEKTADPKKGMRIYGKIIGPSIGWENAEGNKKLGSDIYLTLPEVVGEKDPL